MEMAGPYHVPRIWRGTSLSAEPCVATIVVTTPTSMGTTLPQYWNVLTSRTVTPKYSFNCSRWRCRPLPFGALLLLAVLKSGLRVRTLLRVIIGRAEPSSNTDEWQSISTLLTYFLCRMWYLGGCLFGSETLCFPNLNQQSLPESPVGEFLSFVLFVLLVVIMDRR